jgi:hypothetical protein
LAVVIIAIDNAVIIPVGPYRSSQAADRGADDCARDYAGPSDRANTCANRTADGSTRRNPAERRVITCGGAGIILAVVIIAVDNAIVGARSPGRAGKTADRRADDRALRNTYARKNCARDRSARRAYRCARSYVLRCLRIGCASGKAHGSGGDYRQQGFVHRLSPVLLFADHAPGPVNPRRRCMSLAKTTIAAYRSGFATTDSTCSETWSGQLA